MKKLVMCIYLSLTVLFFSGCDNSKATANVEIHIGESQYFSEAEIQEGINLVKEKFDFKDCTLLKLWYDEEKTEQMKEGYLNNGIGLVNKVKPENVIVILSNFKVDKAGKNPVFSQGATYSNYNWILIRDNKDSQWTISDNGY